MDFIGNQPQEITMTRFTNLSSAVAYERVQDMMLAAERSRTVRDVPPQDSHRTPRRRVAWWHRATARIAGV